MRYSKPKKKGPPAEPETEKTQAELMREKGYIPATDAARHMKVEPKTIYRALDTGELEGASIGPRRYVLIESFLAYAKDGPGLIFDEADL